MRTENFIESIFRELPEHHLDYVELYSNIGNQKLTEILSTVHFELVEELKLLNLRLPTHNETSYYHAADSRRLLAVFEIVERLQTNLKTTQYEFSLDKYYEEEIKLCKEFIVQYRGSTIPPNTSKIELYYTIPIFIIKENNNFNKKINHLMRQNSLVLVLMLMSINTKMKIMMKFLC